MKDVNSSRGSDCLILYCAAGVTGIPCISICIFIFICKKKYETTFNLTSITFLIDKTKQNKKTLTKVADSYGNRRARRGPEKPGLTLFAPECHGWHHHSYGFLPDNNIMNEINQNNTNIWIYLQEQAQNTFDLFQIDYFSTSNPRISSIDWSCSTALEEDLQVWGTASLDQE